METRSRTRSMLRGAAVLAALGALTAPATAGAAVKAPVITKVTPTSVTIGHQLMIRGRNFKRGKGTNRVLFRASTGKSLFVRSGLSTTKQMAVTVPAKLAALLAQRNGAAVATRFRLRVLARRLSRSFTAAKNSPFVAPALKPVAPTAPTAPGGGAAPVSGCPGAPSADDDGDGLSNSTEAKIGTNPCAADSDGDGVTDGFEYRSALDLKNEDPSQVLPYPGSRPYPNPLDATDANTDFDGDGLTLGEEYKLWRYTVSKGWTSSLDDLSYSDGLKYSQYIPAATYPQMADFESYLVSSGRTMVTWPDGVTKPLLDTDRDGTIETPADLPHLGQRWAESTYLDTHGASPGSAPDGLLSDDERDEDADGLSNWVELHGPMLPTWYPGVYTTEHAFPMTYLPLSPTNPDTDGDGVRDGASDEDGDGIPNFDEVSRNMVSDLAPSATVVTSPAVGRVDPYNPCLPFTTGTNCPLYLPMDGTPWAPYQADGTTDPSYVVKY